MIPSACKIPGTTPFIGTSAGAEPDKEDRQQSKVIVSITKVKFVLEGSHRRKAPGGSRLLVVSGSWPQERVPATAEPSVLSHQPGHMPCALHCGSLLLFGRKR